VSILDILKQYTDSSPKPAGEVLSHFDSVAQQSVPATLAPGVAAALRSEATPPLSELVSHLFSQSTPDQKAGVLNEILRSLGAAGLGTGGADLVKRVLGSSALPTSPVTPAQAAQVSPSDAGAFASTVQQQDSSIVDRLGQFYAQHPMLVKSLGVAALGIVMSHMSQQQGASARPGV